MGRDIRSQIKRQIGDLLRTAVPLIQILSAEDLFRLFVSLRVSKCVLLDPADHRSIHAAGADVIAMNAVGISLEPSYLVAAITLSDEREKNTLSFIRKTLATLSPCQLALIRQNILYILYYQYDRYSSLENTWKYFKETLVKFNAHCGVSNLFDNLLEISIYQKQAEDAVILGRPLAPKHHIHYYSDYYLPAILTPALKSLPRASFISPVIPALQEYDQKNSTSLLTTLETYLEQFCHTANTIKELHIHRNTLLCRLKKIEEICDVSLQDYETLLHLMVSFYLLRIT